MRQRALQRLQAGATLEDIATELATSIEAVRKMLGKAAAVRWPKIPVPLENHKPRFIPDGERLGRAALWR